jgi:hypothetical protein
MTMRRAALYVRCTVLLIKESPRKWHTCPAIPKVAMRMG